MKAIINTQYGSPDTLELREISRPEPKPNEVLIKVLAASVNKADWHVLKGEPFPVRIMTGLLKPKFQILGADVAGIVERTGSEVIQFQAGDEVFGDLSAAGFGSFAEYAVAHEKFFARKPMNLSYEQTAALPMASVTALQGLRNAGRIAKGDQVLVNGASGGVGALAIQIAKSFEATVTAVCSTAKMALAKKQGADRVIDYTVEDFTEGNIKYDLIFDVVANHKVTSIARVLNENGRYVSTAFSMGALFRGPWIKLTQGKSMTNLLAKTNQADLQFVSKLAETGKLMPFVQKTYTLDDVPEALWVIGKGSAAGKLVITV